MQGKMLWFNIDKGFGFIRTEEDERLYVARSGFVDGHVPTERCAGKEVTFDRQAQEGATRAPSTSPSRSRWSSGAPDSARVAAAGRCSLALPEPASALHAEDEVPALSPAAAPLSGRHRVRKLRTAICTRRPTVDAATSRAVDTPTRRVVPGREQPGRLPSPRGGDELERRRGPKGPRGRRARPARRERREQPEQRERRGPPVRQVRPARPARHDLRRQRHQHVRVAGPARSRAEQHDVLDLRDVGVFPARR